MMYLETKVAPAITELRFKEIAYSSSIFLYNFFTNELTQLAKWYKQ